MNVYNARVNTLKTFETSAERKMKLEHFNEKKYISIHQFY